MTTATCEAPVGPAKAKQKWTEGFVVQTAEGVTVASVETLADLVDRWKAGDKLTTSLPGVWIPWAKLHKELLKKGYDMPPEPSTPIAEPETVTVVEPEALDKSVPITSVPVPAEPPPEPAPAHQPEPSAEAMPIEPPLGEPVPEPESAVLERKFRGHLTLAADSAEQLRPCDVFRVMESARTNLNGTFVRFYDWLLAQPISDRSKEEAERIWHDFGREAEVPADYVHPDDEVEVVKDDVPDDGLVAEQWGNKLGWNVGEHEVSRSEQDGTWVVTLHREGGDPEYVTKNVSTATGPVDAVRWALGQMAAEDAAVKPVDPPTEEAKPEEPAPRKDPPPFAILPANLGGLAKLCPKDGNPRYALGGVKLEISGDGYRAVVTDGRKLAVVSGPHEFDAADMPTTPAFDQAVGGEASGIIPAAAWTEAFRKIPKKTASKPILGNVAVKVGKNEAHLYSTDLERGNCDYTRLVEGSYPNFDAVKPNPNKMVARVSFTSKYLIELLQAAGAFTESGSESVTFELYADSCKKAKEDGIVTPVVVKTKNCKGQVFDGIIMPLMPPAPKKTK